MGNVYWKQEKWLEAVKWYDKSLAEHRNPDIVSKKNEVCPKIESSFVYSTCIYIPSPSLVLSTALHLVISTVGPT